MPTLGVFAAILDEDGCILCVRMNYAAHAWTMGIEPTGKALQSL
jgi:hypothetical protein